MQNGDRRPGPPPGLSPRATAGPAPGAGDGPAAGPATAPADGAVGRLRLRAPAAGDWGWIIARHGALYAAEFGWGVAYEAFVARIVADFAEGLDPAAEAAWIAELDGVPVGSIACARRDGETAQLRFLLVEPAARGHGAGVALVRACLDFASARGYPRIMLWTASGLAASRGLYERHGFALDDEPRPFPFDAARTEQVWSRALPPENPLRPAKWLL